MLEVVGVEVAVFECGVRQHIVIELNNLEVDALLCKQRFYMLENFGMGRR